MKKWTGGLLVGGLTLVLVLRYSFIGKTPQKQSAYDFFNSHPPDKVNANVNLPQRHDKGKNRGGSDSNVESSQTNVLELLNFKGKPTFLQYIEGITFLYASLGNFSEDESKALLVWARVQFLLSRSDALPETAQGIKEAAISWKELLSTIQEMKTSELKGGVTQERHCPHFVAAFNGTRVSSNLQIPCGLVEGSSITVIGIPDALQDGFQIELLGSQLPNEATPPIVLQYKVFLPGQNLTKDPFVIQNSWTNVSGRGRDEKCPDHGRSTHTTKVDGLVKCSAQIVRTTALENLNASQPGSDKLSNVSDEGPHGSTNSPFPFVEGIPFPASLWVGVEELHMTVNGRHGTSFAFREVRYEP